MKKRIFTFSIYMSLFVFGLFLIPQHQTEARINFSVGLGIGYTSPNSFQYNPYFGGANFGGFPSYGYFNDPYFAGYSPYGYGNTFNGGFNNPGFGGSYYSNFSNIGNPYNDYYYNPYGNCGFSCSTRMTGSWTH